MEEFISKVKKQIVLISSRFLEQTRTLFSFIDESFIAFLSHCNVQQNNKRSRLNRQNQFSFSQTVSLFFPNTLSNQWIYMHCCSIQFSWKFYSSCVGVLCNQSPKTLDLELFLYEILGTIF